MEILKGTVCKRISLLIVLLGTLMSSQGQDIQFSQFYVAQTYVNPAFVGGHHHGRATLHSRIQWPKLQAKYYTYMVTADEYFKLKRMGAGIYILHDVQGGGIVKSTKVAGQYSYEFNISKEWVVRAGLEIGLTSQFADLDNLVFLDQIDDRGDVSGGNGLNGTNQKLYPDISTGGLIYSHQFWFGASFHHINSPNKSHIGETSTLPMKSTFITGYKFFLKKEASYVRNASSWKEYSITPTAHFKMQGSSKQFDLGVYTRLDHIIFGGWYRGIPLYNEENNPFKNHESIVLLGGMTYKGIFFNYSYDIHLSSLTRSGTGGAHELSLTFVSHPRHHNKSTKGRRRLPCPKYISN